ncbi:MAG: PAS domain S-box protein, partial [Bacteroidota bacterium]|nr:PAS domain S-box protein [Bacteroidota bacterium]
VEQSPSIVIITDTNGAIEYVNPKFCEVTGYAATEVLGRNPRLLKSPNSAVGLYRSLWKTLASGEEWRGELENRRRDGSSYWVLSSISPLKGQDGQVTHYIGIQEDITERKRTEWQLQRRTEELETVDRIVSILNGAFDLPLLMRSLLEQGMILLPQARRSRLLIFDPAQQALVTADAVEKDEAFGSIYMGAGPSRTATESTVSLDTLLSDRIAVYALGDGSIRGFARVDRAQAAATETSEHDGACLIVMSVRFGNAQEGGEDYLLFESAGEGPCFTEADARRLLRYREHAVTALAKARTLQALRNKNEELLRTQEQLVVQQKLASLGQLTAGIAHEIRNPLNFINNFALTANELTEEIQSAIDLGDDPAALLAELRLAAEKIHEHGSRANRIVEGMLLHARSKRGEMHPTEINRLVQDATHLAYHGMRASIPEFHVTMEHMLDPAVERARIVPQEVSRVLLSLLDNAFYAVWKKKRSLPDTTAYAPLVLVATARVRDSITITVRDNGDGIPADVLAHIFDPFFTTKPAGEGTGLGLSLSHEIIVKEHGGNLEVRSREGSWTEFVITLYDHPTKAHTPQQK